MHKSITSYATILCVLSFAATAFAQFSLYDGFETPGQYTPGANVAGQGGGTGDWNGNWSAPAAGSGFLTESTSLNYSQGGNDLATTNGSLAKLVTGGGTTTYHRPIDNSAIAGATELWFSVLFQTNDVSRFWFTVANVENATPRGPGFYLNGGEIYGLINNDISTGSFNSVSGETYFVIGKMTTDVAENDTTLDLWVDPDLTGDLPVSSITATDDSYSILNSNFISIRSNTNTTVIFDEMRVGTTLDSVRVVIPEPGFYAISFGIFAMLGGILFRHRGRFSRLLRHDMKVPHL